VYLFSISIAGCFRAWVAKMMGDRTAEHLGFLTLNPLVHIDPIGITFLVISYFGWSKLVPVNPNNIDGSIRTFGIRTGWRIPKLIFVFLSDSIAYFTMAFIALITLVLVFGSPILFVAPAMLVHPSCMSHLSLAHAFPYHSSMTIVIGFILVVLAYLCIVVGVLDAIINFCNLGMALIAEHAPDIAMQYGYLTLIVPMILIFCCATRLRLLVTGIMLYGGWFFAHIFGLA
jgi:hypothetical protein